MCEFANEKRVAYGEEGEQAVYVPRCIKCMRFVKAPDSVKVDSNKPNTECKKCGPTQMILEGWF